MKARKEERRANYSNVRSLALERAPELFPQAGGQLSWETGAIRAEARRMREGGRQEVDALVRAQD
eukprot:6089129-Lingulodinium_polyedra.AAC.1